MKQIIYVMQFKGQAAPSAEANNVLQADTKASSCVIRSVADANGVSGTIEAIEGGESHFESQVTITGETTFLESGSIRFGSGAHKLYFSSVGQGHLDVCADPNLKHGSVIWKLERGEGQFAGASGLITSNFTVSNEGEVVDNHFGVIFVS